MMSARRVVLFAIVALLLTGCATPGGAPLLTDAQRCGRWGGSWDGHTCRHGGGP